MTTPEELNLDAAFDPHLVADKLHSKPSLADSPAIAVLSRQIEANKTDILRKKPLASRQEIAISLVVRFFKTSLYQRISEQALFGVTDFERFDNPTDLDNAVAGFRNKMRVVQNELAIHLPYLRKVDDNGWLHVDNEHTQTEYRIYLSPAATSVPAIFYFLAKNIDRTTPFQMKTFSEPTKGVDLSRMDKIIIYCDENSFADVLEVVKNCYRFYSTAFHNRPCPGGGTIAVAPGVSAIHINSSPDRKEQKTGTEQIADAIADKINTFLPTVFDQSFAQFSTTTELNSSDHAKYLFQLLQQEVVNRYDFGFLGEKTDDSAMKELKGKYSKVLYHTLSLAVVQKRAIQYQLLKDLFLDQVTRTNILNSKQLTYLRTNIDNMSKFKPSGVDPLMHAVKIRVGLAIVFDFALARKKSFADVIKTIVSK